MKSCPKCGQTYTDETLNFCLTDGTALTTLSGDIPTVVIPRNGRPKKGKGLLWAGLIVLFILIAAGSLIAVLLFRSSGKDDQKVGVNVSTSPPASTPRQKASPSPSPNTAATPQPSPSAAKNDEPENSSDEVTPIMWETTAGGFKGEPGKTYRFECPKGGTSHGVYGSDVYTDYSSICTAAVHAGIISLESGGEVTIEYRPGREIYGSTTRNDVRTNTAGENRRSFVVR